MVFCYKLADDFIQLTGCGEVARETQSAPMPTSQSGQPMSYR